jgi:hypothetical protein
MKDRRIGRKETERRKDKMKEGYKVWKDERKGDMKDKMVERKEKSVMEDRKNAGQEGKKEIKYGRTGRREIWKEEERY